MPIGNNIPAQFEQRIRARLVELTSRHPQAELARKAGVSKANVHRYLKHNRIPASLCAAIIENLGINANWLMTGRGALAVSGATAGEGANVGSLMELVETMNHAARLNLGALTDKAQLKAARELSDTLQRYEQTRAKLSATSRQVLRRVLDDWRIAYRALKGEQCRTLRESASQLARLCEDEDLRLECIELDAQTESMFGDERRALELQRKLVTLTLLRRGTLDDECVSRVNMLLGLLESHGLLREALRLGRATLELAQGVTLSRQPLSILRMNVGSQAMELGELEDAMVNLRRSVHESVKDTRTRNFATAFWMLAQYWAGAMDFEQARHFGNAWWGRAEFLMLMALWEEDPRAMRLALAEYKEGLKGTSTQPNTESITITFALRALREKDANIVEAAHSALRERQPDETALANDRFASEVFESEVAWLAGQRALCARLLECAARTLDSMDQAVDPVVLPRALYWRLILRLEDNPRFDKRQAAARAYFDSMSSRGYARLEIARANPGSRN